MIKFLYTRREKLEKCLFYLTEIALEKSSSAAAMKAKKILKALSINPVLTFYIRSVAKNEIAPAAHSSPFSLGLFIRCSDSSMMSPESTSVLP
jgi:hypothetical protein